MQAHKTHKLLMNYLGNSTGIYVRFRQHPELKSYLFPPLPRIPKETVTEVKFLYINTGNTERPTFSAIASMLVGLGLCWQTNGACSAETSSHISADKCQFAVSSPIFLHLWVHNHTPADEPENSRFIPPSEPLYHLALSTVILDLLNSALNPACPFRCRTVSKSISAQLSPLSLSVGHGRWCPCKPSSPSAQTHQAVTKSSCGTAAILSTAAFLLLPLVGRQSRVRG